MKHVRVRARIDPERAPAFFDVAANSPGIAEVRLIDWNLAAETESLLLFAVDGDAAPLADAAEGLPGVEDVEVSTESAEHAHALVRIRRDAVPIFGCMARALDDGGLLIRKPVVVSDGEFRCRVVGDAGPLQEALEREGDGVQVRIDEISSSPASRPSSELTDRQREALSVALESGYYDRPREATHEDVAAALDCAPQTAGEHLKKAEGRLVRAALDDFGPES